jgi:exodeoxyribonuclease VII large subunit
LLLQKNRLQENSSELKAQSPALSVQRSIGQLQQIYQRLATSTRVVMSDANHRIALLGRALNSVSPLATLDRGYAIVKQEKSGAVLMNSSSVSPGDDVRAQLARGEIVATVKKVITDD